MRAFPSALPHLAFAFTVVLSLCLLPSSARAEPLLSRDTADVGSAGSYSIGVFNPLKVAVSDGVELQAHPLLFFVAPNLTVRIAQGELGGFRLASEYGLWCPTPLMRLTQGFLFPTWDHGSGEVGWSLVPQAGLVATRGHRASRTLTLAADIAVGIPLTRDDLTAPGGIAPLDDWLAPVTTGFRARLNVAYDVSLVSWLRGRAYLGLSLHGKNPSPVAFSGGLSLDLAVGRNSRFTLGMMWWNADTREMDLRTHQHVRSNDFFPTLDFIWAG
ncbi:MAG: hypothetical protein HY901_13955 [Deltaproteobacteria bacterium]|nr:hypothetical protein [Deltaproteobacteria bacterium]